MKLADLKQYRAALLDKAEKIAETAEAENRNFTEAEQTDYDHTIEEAKDLRSRIEREEARRAEMGVHTPDATPESPEVGMSRSERKRYSIARAIRASLTGDWSDAGLEKAASDAEAARRGHDARSFFVPHDVLVEQRDVTVGTGTADQLVEDSLLQGSFIDHLYNRMILRSAGITMMPGLVGDVSVPKALTAITAYWVAEDGAPTESTPAWTQVSMTPHTVGAYVDISRKTLQQARPAVDALVENEIATRLALAIDYAGLHGDDGTDANQPDGVISTTGIGDVAGGTDGAAPDWADIVKLETEIAQDNADIGRMAYITNAKVRGKLKVTETASGNGIFVWNGNNLNGYNALVSNQVRSNLVKGTSGAVCSAIFFGAWSNLVCGLWGGLDVLVDPFTLSTSGQVRIVGFQSVDFAVRYPQAFAAMKDALTA
jgi:HK97 family phage major capsid protein